MLSAKFKAEDCLELRTPTTMRWQKKGNGVTSLDSVHFLQTVDLCDECTSWKDGFSDSIQYTHSTLYTMGLQRFDEVKLLWDKPCLFKFAGIHSKPLLCLIHKICFWTSIHPNYELVFGNTKRPRSLRFLFFFGEISARCRLCFQFP